MILMLCLTIQLLAFHVGMLYSSRSTSSSHEGLPLRVRRGMLAGISVLLRSVRIFHDGVLSAHCVVISPCGDFSRANSKRLFHLTCPRVNSAAPAHSGRSWLTGHCLAA